MKYEYRCEYCGKLEHEYRMINHRDDDKICQCGQMMRRVPIASNVCVKFKGSGFYSTDSN